jgi:Amt family ammonium transporter
LWIQAVAVIAAIVYSGAASFLLLKLIGLVIPLRAEETHETAGLDLTQHGEEAYIHEGGVRGAIPVYTDAESAGAFVTDEPATAS